MAFFIDTQWFVCYKDADILCGGGLSMDIFGGPLERFGVASAGRERRRLNGSDWSVRCVASPKENLCAQ
jgi:hypothetical protein